jgi:membrane protein implicated in regulation of membrane protease activity
MSVWHYWVIGGILLLILEIFTTGFLLASFGFAALAAALSAYLGADLEIQLLVFAGGTLLFFFGIRPFYLRYFKRFDSPRRTGVEALIGRACTVTEPIDTDQGTGRVKVGGEDWRALPENDATLAAGTRVEVVRVEGATLYVRQVDQGE